MQPMQVLPVNNFGLGGLVQDVPATKRTPTQLSAATNIRIQDGEIATIPEPTTAYTFTKKPTFAEAFYQLDDSGGHIVCYDDYTIGYIDSTGAESDITPTPPPSSAINYVGVQLNDVFFLTNGIDLPWQITAENLVQGGTFQPMDNWPSQYRCKLMRPYKSHMVVSGLYIEGVEQRSMIKWSHPMTPGDTALFWDHTDPTLLAGETVLATNGRNVAALQPLRDNMMIYLDQSVWRMSYVGGGLVMGFTKTFTDDGSIGSEAHADYDGNAIVVGYSDIYITDGFNKSSISDNKVTRAFYSTAVISDDIKVSYYPDRREVFILYRSNNTYTEHNLAMIYNVDAGAFTLMTLPGTNGLGGVIRAYLGPKFESVDTSYDEAGAAGWTYDNQAETTYASLRTVDENTDFFLLTGEGMKLQAMDGQQVHAHRPTDVYVEVDRIDMQRVFGSTGDKIKYISRLFPQFSGTDTVQMSIGVAMLPTGGIEWKSWRNFDLESSWAHDQRAAGRYMGVRLRMEPTNTKNFSLAGFDVEIMQPDGGRR